MSKGREIQRFSFLSVSILAKKTGWQCGRDRSFKLRQTALYPAPLHFGLMNANKSFFKGAASFCVNVCNWDERRTFAPSHCAAAQPFCILRQGLAKALKLPRQGSNPLYLHLCLNPLWCPGWWHIAEGGLLH